MGPCQQSKQVWVVKVDVYSVRVCGKVINFPQRHLPKKNKNNCESEIEARNKLGNNEKIKRVHIMREKSVKKKSDHIRD